MPRILAKRYAQAVFQIAIEEEKLEQWRENLNKLMDIIRRPGLLPLLENPKLSLEEKRTILKEISGDIEPKALNLMLLLISHGRIRFIQDIVQEYQKLMLKHYGLEEAELITAIPLGEGDKRFVEERLGELLGRKLKLSHKVEPGVLGGVVVRGESWLFDGSLKGKLEGLRKNLLPIGR